MMQLNDIVLRVLKQLKPMLEFLDLIVLVLEFSSVLVKRLLEDFDAVRIVSALLGISVLLKPQSALSIPSLDKTVARA